MGRCDVDVEAEMQIGLEGQLADFGPSGGPRLV